MPDVVSPQQRSRMMAGIRSKNTKPELQLRRALHRLRLRFRLHDARYPGRPDLLSPRHGAAIFAHGCFWHAHDCPAFKWPATRKDFWLTKISANQRLDQRNIAALHAIGMRVCIVWECALRKAGADAVAWRVAAWLRREDSALLIISV